jgi:cellobiose phosphorylase
MTSRARAAEDRPRGLERRGFIAAGKRHKGESVWLAQALVRSLKYFVELCELVGDAARAEEFSRKARTMTDRINDVGWDGEWYKRGFTDDGLAYGTKDYDGGKIFLNTQAVALLSAG